MCGLAAIFGQDHLNPKEIKTMIASIAHRGPDHQGFFENDKVLMGSCRLSIFDFSNKGNMPMSDKTGRYVIIYNGEIYNFKELKKKHDIITKSETDTEVLIELFAKLNVECFKLLNGIFSLIIFDNLEKKIYSARDRLGVKPLYYFKKKNNFYFCSEIKGILRVNKDIQINSDIVKFYLNTSFYDSFEETFYKDILQVEQGTYIIFDLNKKNLNKKRYWDLNDDKNLNNSFELFDQHLTNSFSIQQRSDTKIGVNVSSGVDSNLMISYLNLINKGQNNILANSYYFSDPEYDYRKDLNDMSQNYGWKINCHEIKSQDIIENFEEVSNFQDEPFPGIVTIAKHILIKKSYPSDCKVILEGQGGDEAAGGYKYIYPLYILDLIKKFKFSKAFNEVKDFKIIENIDNKEFYSYFINSLKGYFYGGVSADGTKSNSEGLFLFSSSKNHQMYKIILKKIAQNKSFLKRIIYRDIFYCKLPRILRSCDRASMAYSKELRVPLLDHNIVNFLFSIDNNKMINKGILRDYYRNFALEKFKHNKYIKQKKYYVSDPQTKWLKTSIFNWMYDILTSKSLHIESLINKKKLTDYLNNFKKNDRIKNSNLIWQLISLEHLLKKNRLTTF